MSLAICASCLSRLRLSSRSSIPRPAVPGLSKSSFHTSPIHQGDGQNKKKRATGKNVYRNTSPQTYKKKKRVVPKLLPVGERRMLRKRIVLSNTNAYEIKGMQNLSPSNMADERYVGQMLGLEGNLLDQLRNAKAFKKAQNWNLFRRPATLMRRETVEMGRNFDAVNASVEKGDANKPVLRQVIAGERVSGKSILLLQALSMAYMNKWIVINVPEAQDFTVNQSNYAPAPLPEGSEEEQTYIQPQLAAELLQRLATSNQPILKYLQPNHEIPKFITGITRPESLYDIANLGGENPPIAQQVWEHLLRELTQSGTQPRPPTLIAIDGLDHWMGPTKYRAADYTIIHAHQFVLIKQLLSLLFTNNPFTYGGMVIGATSKANSPVYPTFEVLLKQITALNEGLSMTDGNFPMPSPYAQADLKVLSLLIPSKPSNQLKVTHLNGLTKPETAGLLKYFTNSGILKDAMTEQSIAEKWTMSSGGVVGELCRLGVAARVDPEKRVTGFGTHEGVRVGQGEHRPKG